MDDVTMNWLNDEFYWTYEGNIHVVDQYNSAKTSFTFNYKQTDLTIDPLTRYSTRIV